ncbi:tryptophan--tRNA ligase [Phycisphaerales bacterium AB-hyl4]|uniref:Tryptophan--tRNA ligase n=1 Tax=Natronomicrosphaera hydrolytica TaxID=3242702 RepID=A0ABV4U4T1_9BACT
MSTAEVTSIRPRILTGDTPTGRLHLGHWVGSVEHRVQAQYEYDCFFIIANVHALTTRAEESAAVREDVFQITMDYLAAGIDPQQSVIFLQSEVPAIAELTWYFAMLLPFNRLMRNPTLKTEIELKGLGDHYSFGFPMYAVGQVADILAFRANAVPVGEDQIPHIEMTREVARRFNIVYAGVNPQAGDEAHAEQGVFPIPEAKMGRVSRLSGIDGKAKMSKSLNNAIFLSDTPKQVKKKCGRIFTGRMAADSPGVIEGNPLWEYHDTFNPDKAEVEDMKARYREGKVGDGECKMRLADVINELLEPMRQRRAEFEADPDKVLDVLRDGTRRANVVAEQTLAAAKAAMKFDFLDRKLEF